MNFFKKIPLKILSFLIIVFLSFTLAGCAKDKIEEEIIVDTEEELEKVIEEDLEKIELSIIIEELHKIIIDGYYTIRNQPFDVFQNLRETRDKLKSINLKNKEIQKLLNEGIDEVFNGFKLYEKADISSNEDEDAIKIIEEGKAKIDSCYDMLNIQKMGVGSYVAEIEYICKKWNEAMNKSRLVVVRTANAVGLYDQFKEMKREVKLIYTKKYTGDIQEIHRILINIIDETTSAYSYLAPIYICKSELAKVYGHIERTQSYINNFHNKLLDLGLEGTLIKDIYKPYIKSNCPFEES